MQPRLIFFLSVGLYAITERVDSEDFILTLLRLLSILANYQLPVKSCM